MNLKIGFLTISILFASSQAIALDCIPPPYKATLTFHCEEECTSSLEEGFNGLKLNSSNIPEPGNNYSVNTKGQITEDVQDPRKNLYEVKTIEKRNLPDAKEAQEIDKKACSGPPNIHLYPVGDWERQELEDTSNCYKTEVKKNENYYTVERKSVTSPITCTRKRKGYTTYAAKVDQNLIEFIFQAGRSILLELF